MNNGFRDDKKSFSQTHYTHYYIVHTGSQGPLQYLESELDCHPALFSWRLAVLQLVWELWKVEKQFSLAILETTVGTRPMKGGDSWMLLGLHHEWCTVIHNCIHKATCKAYICKQFLHRVGKGRRKLWWSSTNNTTRRRSTYNQII